MGDIANDIIDAGMCSDYPFGYGWWPRALRVRHTPRELARLLVKTTKCQCRPELWPPEETTGHSWTCSIHREAMKQAGKRD